MEQVKKIFYFYFAFTCIISFYSCEDDKQIPVEPEVTIKNTHTIPQEVALANLRAFMEESSEDVTRGIADERKVCNVFTIKCNENVTRAFTENELDCENLLYVANFENEQGFAVLAADDRIPDEVIALTNNGSASPIQFMNDPLTQTLDRPILKGFPTSGDGFFTDQQYPDEEFMNPNTAVMYDEEEEDTLIGNFVLDEEDEYEGEYAADNSDAAMSIIRELSLSYAISAIQKNQVETRGSSNSNIRLEIVTSSWSEYEHVYPLLYKYKSWHQRSPFNDLYPTRRNYLLPWKKYKAAAGCFPLAIAKVMTYLKVPATYTYKGYTIDWNNVNANVGTSHQLTCSEASVTIATPDSSTAVHSQILSMPENS